MKNFEFIIKDNSKKAFQSFFLFLLFLHVMAGGILILFAPGKTFPLVTYIFTGLFVVAIILFKFFRSGKKLFNSYQLILFTLFAIFWLLHVGILAMVFCVILLSLVKILQVKKASIYFNEDAIILKNILFSKNFSWAQVDYVVLKDGLLTISFKSNKVIQVEVVYEPSLNNIIFNTFITDKIKSVHQVEL